MYLVFDIVCWSTKLLPPETWPIQRSHQMHFSCLNALIHSTNIYDIVYVLDFYKHGSYFIDVQVRYISRKQVGFRLSCIWS